jgi:hypothetical protein
MIFPRLTIISFIMVLILTGCVVIKQSPSIKPTPSIHQCPIYVQDGTANHMYYSSYDIKIIK